jgi:hypothetical protein
MIYPHTPITGNVIYAATNGNNSESRAWALNNSGRSLSLGRAASVVNAGDTVVVRNGQYNMTLNPTRNGTAQNPIRFVAENRWGAIIDGGTTQGVLNSGRRWNLDVAASHIIVEGFVLQRAQKRGVSCTSARSHVVVRGCRIWGAGGHAINTSTSGTHSHGIYINARSRYFWFDGNFIYSNGRPAASGYAAQKLDWGAYLVGHGHTFSNNVCFDNRGGASLRLDLAIRDTPRPPDNERSAIIINNTFAGATNGTGSQKRQIAFYQTHGSNNVEPRNVLIMNNVFWDLEGGRPLHIGTGFGWPWYGFEVIHNITTANGMISFGGSTSTGQFGCGASCQYRRIHGNITNASGNLGMRSPKRTGALETDFEIVQSNSALINAGLASYNTPNPGVATVTVPTWDRWNRARVGAPDLGAFEYRS